MCCRTLNLNPKTQTKTLKPFTMIPKTRKTQTPKPCVGDTRVLWVTLLRKEPSYPIIGVVLSILLLWGFCFAWNQLHQLEQRNHNATVQLLSTTTAPFGPSAGLTAEFTTMAFVSGPDSRALNALDRVVFCAVACVRWRNFQVHISVKVATCRVHVCWITSTLQHTSTA